MAAPTASHALFVGRDQERALLFERLETLGAGSGHVVILEGEAGVGKTCLIQEVLIRARELGTAVHHAQPEELEWTRPFGPLADALGCRLGATHPGRALIGRALAGDIEASEFQIVEQLLALTAELADELPLVLAVDDLQWADPSTLRALRSMGRRLADAPVLMLLAARPAPRSVELTTLIRQFEAGGSTRILLTPLDDVAIRVLIEASLGAPPGPGLTAHVARAAGNPLFVTELLRAFVEGGAVRLADGVADVVVDSTLPASLRATILGRLAPFEGPAMDLLRKASLLGTAFTLRDLSAVLRRPAVELTEALGEALEHHVLVDAGDRLAFRHDLIRDAVYEDMPLDVRRALHRDVASALAEAGAPATQVAWHHWLGGRPGDTTAVDWLRRAAREQAARAPAVAVDLLRRALELVPRGSSQRDEIILDLIRPLVDRGEGDEAVALAREVLAGLHDPQLRARAYRLLSHAQLLGDFAGAQAALDEGLSVAGLADYDRAALLADRTNLTIDPDEAIARGEQALGLAEAAGNDHARIRALTTLAPRRVPVATALSLANTAADAARALCGQQDRDAEAIYLLGDALFLRAKTRFELDEFEPGQRDLREALRLAERLGAVAYVPIIYNDILKGLWHSGEWEDAMTEAATALALAEDVGAKAEVTGVLALAALIHLQRDEIETAERHINRAVALPPPSADPLNTWLSAALVSFHHVRGEPVVAVRHAREAVALQPQARMDAVHAGLAAGDLEFVRSITEVAEGDACKMQTPFREALALRCRGLVDQDVVALLTAVSAHRRIPRPFFLAGACEDAARALHRVGRAEEARALATEASAGYERLGARWDIARADALLRELGVRRGARSVRTSVNGGWSSLTKTEQRVVALVREGLTNAQIGERMYISHRTVSTHLTHVYAKVGVSSRAELAARSAARSPR